MSIVSGPIHSLVTELLIAGTGYLQIVFIVKVKLFILLRSISHLHWNQELFSEVRRYHSRQYTAKACAYLCQHCLGIAGVGEFSEINHALAPNSRTCLTYMMLEENPLFHSAAVRSAERVPSGLQSPTYWELYFYTDCWRHVRNRWPRPNTAFVVA